MRKLIFIFLVLFTLVIVAGCNARQNTTHFDEDGKPTTEEQASDQTTTTITRLDATDDEEKVDSPLTINTIKADDTGHPTDLEVTSLENSYLETTTNYHVIRGTAPFDAHTIKVNDYTLQKYYPGQKTWSYITSTYMQTLADGQNDYVVRAFDVFDNEIDSIEFTVIYSAPDIPELPTVGFSTWIYIVFASFMSGLYFVGRRLLSGKKIVI